MENYEMILKLLKIDLQISSAAIDPYLQGLIERSISDIQAEGIELFDSRPDHMLVVQYASYLYRLRKDPGRPFPRSLRLSLNNKLFNQKGGA